ncbi:ABC transporter ATP-binding protein [Eubacterium sp. CAG:156]|uniref:ABC transporter ATP-binding protein n=1 Tax=Eubacterium sp. CAG:156 TaxID=1262880 RepID=UPI0003394009|nr:aBC transporter ATP-binding protein [Eubacterium sp. CAG:156]
MRFFKNFKGHMPMVFTIIAFLFIQAMCDLSLPDYTASLIDTGINNSGIEYATPEKISEESYQGIAMWMTDKEKSKWESAYKKQSNGNYKLKDKSKENMEKLDKTFSEPILVYSMISQTQDKKNNNENTGQDVSEYMKEIDMDSLDNQAKMDLAAVQNGTMTQEQFMAAHFDLIRDTVRDKMGSAIDSMGDSLVQSSAISFVKKEYKKIGVDVETKQVSYLWSTGAKMLAMALLMTVSAIIVGFLASKVSASIGKELREKVFNKVLEFSDAEINKFSTASLITRSTNDVQQIQMVCVMLLRMVAYAPILAVGGIIMVIKTHSGMEWIIVVAVAALLCLVAILMALAMPKFKIMQDLVDRVNLVSREILTGIPVIRAFSREKKEEERFDVANKSLTKVMLFTNRVMTFMMPLMMMVMYGITILIEWVASHRINQGALEVGSMTAFITYTMQIVMSFLMITMVSIMLPRATVAAERIDDVLDTDVSIKDKKEAKMLDAPKGIVEFKNVDFKYPDGDTNVLEGIDFIAKPGETTAIIGSTGSGKSTVAKLIPRFYDVTEGQITIDGIDVKDLSQKSIRDNIGYVPQKGILFSGTIASNIKYGAENASDEQMLEAATIAQATEFIDCKEEKYDSPISQGGTNVSGGQKQRLSIARAIAKNPRIYIFDDSFSALDFKTDAALRKALSPKVKESTVIIVAQRISTVLQAKQIIVLDDGKMVGKGTHKELMKNCEVYKQIASSQMSEAELAASLNEEVDKDE